MSLESITEESLGIRNRDTEGLVFVVDLDNTLVGNYFDVRTEPETPLLINEKLLRFLRLAKARTKDVSAIFLLTNNADHDFIRFVVISTANRRSNGYFEPLFDYVMDRNHPSRPQSVNPPKRLEDVAYMMREIGESTQNLARRVVFIDDRPDHAIRGELANPDVQYIQITPPFTGAEVSDESLAPLMKLMNMAKGGSRLRRLLGKTRRFRRRARSHLRKSRRIRNR